MSSPTNRRLATALLLLIALTGGCAGSQRPAASPPSDLSTELGTALAGSQRSPESRARDVYRHPRETLEFFGLRDDMTVLELWPGGGWYTEILAPVLAGRGKLIATNSDDVAERIRKDPAVFGKVTLRALDTVHDNSVDLVLTFRNVHNWMQAGVADRIFAGAFRVLKGGGILGLVEHRATPGTDAKASTETGYVSEHLVAEFATQAGFVLDGRTEINANPKDTKDHPGGVWALPPSLRNGEVDRAKYVAIGESDRMTLRFKKP